MMVTINDKCPGCGEPWDMFTSGSNLHFYELARCPNNHEWCFPYDQETIDYWMKVNNARA